MEEDKSMAETVHSGDGNGRALAIMGREEKNGRRCLEARQSILFSRWAEGGSGSGKLDGPNSRYLR